MNIDENMNDPEENNPFVKEVLENDKKQAFKPDESSKDHKKSTNITEKSKNKKILEKKRNKDNEDPKIDEENMVKSKTEIRDKKTKKKENKSKTEKKDKKEEKNKERGRKDNYKEDDTSIYKFIDMLENKPSDNLFDDECQKTENDPSQIDFNYNDNNCNEEESLPEN